MWLHFQAAHAHRALPWLVSVLHSQGGNCKDSCQSQSVQPLSLLLMA